MPSAAAVLRMRLANPNPNPSQTQGSVSSAARTCTQSTSDQKWAASAPRLDTG